MGSLIQDEVDRQRPCGRRTPWERRLERGSVEIIRQELRGSHKYIQKIHKDK